MRVPEAVGIVDGGKERGGDGADAGDDAGAARGSGRRSRSWHRDYVSCPLRGRVRAVVRRPSAGASAGGSVGPGGQSAPHSRRGRGSRAARRHRRRMMSRVRVRTRASRTTKRPRRPLGIGEPEVRPEQARLGQGTSRPVGLDLARPAAYIGARFGSATITSWLSASRQRHPFAVGRGLDDDPGAGPRPHCGRSTRSGSV